MSKPLLELFRAEWCGYCKRFEADWEELTKIDNVDCKMYEHTDPKDKTHFENNNITGYPTIYITVNGQKEKYTGKRSVNDIMNYICNKMPNQKDCDIRYPVTQEAQAGGDCGQTLGNSCGQTLGNSCCKIKQSGGNCGCKQSGGKKKVKKTKNVDDAKYELKYYKYKAKYLKIKDK